MRFVSLGYEENKRSKGGRWVSVRKTWVGGDCLQSLGSELNESESLVLGFVQPWRKCLVHLIEKGGVHLALQQ